MADLYDPDNSWLYPELTTAQQELDAAVEQAYGLPLGYSEAEIISHLFELYAKATVE